MAPDSVRHQPSAAIHVGHHFRASRTSKKQILHWAVQDGFKTRYLKPNGQINTLVCVEKTCKFKVRTHWKKMSEGVEVTIVNPNHIVCIGVLVEKLEAQNHQAFLLEAVPNRVSTVRPGQQAFWRRTFLLDSIFAYDLLGSWRAREKTLWIEEEKRRIRIYSRAREALKQALLLKASRNHHHSYACLIVLAFSLSRLWRRTFYPFFPVCCPHDGGILQAPLCPPPRSVPRR